MLHQGLPYQITDVCAKLGSVPPGIFNRLPVLTQLDEMIGHQTIPRAESYNGWHMTQQSLQGRRQSVARYCFIHEDGQRYVIPLTFGARVVAFEVYPVGKQLVIKFDWQGGRVSGGILGYAPPELLKRVTEALVELEALLLNPM